MAISPNFKSAIKEAGEQLQDISRSTNRSVAKTASKVVPKAAPILALPAPKAGLSAAQQKRIASNAARQKPIKSSGVINANSKDFDRLHETALGRALDMTKRGGFSGAPSPQIAGHFFDSGNKEMMKNFASAGGRKTVAGTAVRSAAVGAGIGAVTSAAQGEDVWEGAARGGAIGAIGGATVRGSRMAMGVGKGQGFMDAATGFNNRHRYTDSVKTLMGTALDTRASMQFINKTNR